MCFAVDIFWAQPINDPCFQYPVFVLFSIPEVNGKDEDFNIDVKQKNAEVYHEQSSKNSMYF